VHVHDDDLAVHRDVCEQPVVREREAPREVHEAAARPERGDDRRRDARRTVARVGAAGEYDRSRGRPILEPRVAIDRRAELPEQRDHDPDEEDGDECSRDLEHP
jgi:hypothetical protein